MQAFRLLAERRPDVELFLIGPPSIPEYSLPRGVHFLGDLPVHELNEYFNLCDVFCLPSRFEAYGLVFIEALSFGLPCIGRAAYAMPEFIEHGTTGFLMDSDDPSELVEYMLRVLEDHSFADTVRQRRDYYLNEYSWTAVADRVARVIDKRMGS